MKRIAVDHPTISRVLHDFLQDDHDIYSFFSHPPFMESSFRERASIVDQTYDSSLREPLAEVIRAFHQPELWSPMIEESLARLQQPNSLVIIGGQQAGLLTGPLYTIHKAVTLIQLAKREEARLNRPVIPVFWIAGEDHDRDEVDHIWVQNWQGTPVKHRLRTGRDEKRSVAHAQLHPEEVHAWLNELSTILPDRPDKQEWLAQCKAWSAETTSWTRFFARIMHHLFAKWGLLLIDAADPALRRLEVPFFRRLILQNEAIHQCVLATAENWIEHGYTPAIELAEGQGNLFLDIAEERLLLLRDGEDWVTKKGNHRFSTDDLLHLLETSPERFSNNVVTRPLMQEYLFPTLAFVGGPGEIAYWALLKSAFSKVDLAMPIVYPRLQFTLLNPMAEKRMEEFQLTWHDLLPSLPFKRAEWLRSQHQPPIEERFSEAKRQISQIMQPLVKSLAEEIGRDVQEMGRKNENKILEQVDYLSTYISRILELKYETQLRHWRELEQLALPEQKPQERLYNLVQIWNQYGLDWIDQLVESPCLTQEEERLHHCIVL